MPKIPGMDAAQKMGVEASSKVIGSAMTEIIQKSIKLMEEVATVSDRLVSFVFYSHRQPPTALPAFSFQSMVMARSNADFQKVLADALNAFYEMQQIAMGVAQQMM